MEINPTEGVHVGTKEVVRVCIDSDSDYINPESDHYLIMKIKEFHEKNPHLSIEHKVFHGPDSCGYENWVELYVENMGWYDRALKINTRVRYKDVEYLSFGIWGTSTDKPVIRLIEMDTKCIIDIPVKEFNAYGGE